MTKKDQLRGTRRTPTPRRESSPGRAAVGREEARQRAVPAAPRQASAHTRAPRGPPGGDGGTAGA